MRHTIPFALFLTMVANEGDPLLPVSTVDHHGGQAATTEGHEEEDVHQGVLATIAEGAATLVEDATETLHNVQEDAMDELQEVQDAFAEETEDNESSYFLEMSLTRTWSFLPSDLPEVSEAVDYVLGAPETRDTSVAPESEQPKVPFHAYFLLALTVIAMSSIGPMLDLQQDCSPTTKIFWRMSGTAMFLLPPCCIDLVRQGGLPKLTVPQITTFIVAAFCYAVLSNGFVLAIDYTSVGNAVILANCQAILFLFGRVVVGDSISLLEGIGASTAFLGAVLCSKDGSAASDEQSAGKSLGASLYGDCLALMAGIGGAFYLVFAKTVRSHVTLYTFMFCVMAVGSTFTLLFQMFVLEEHVTFDRDPHHGTWGWMNLLADRLPLEVSMVLVCNLMGSVGYIRAMQHFDPLVVSTAGLMEPVIASFLVFFLGLGALPGWLGWIGNLFVAVGTLAVIYPTNNGNDTSKKTAAH